MLMGSVIKTINGLKKALSKPKINPAINADCHTSKLIPSKKYAISARDAVFKIIFINNLFIEKYKSAVENNRTALL